MEVKIVCRWVLHNLIEHQKEERIRISKRTLKLLNGGGYHIIFEIVTCDETNSRSIKKRSPPIYFNANYRTEIKLIPINMDYCLLQFVALNFFSGMRLHG